MHNLTKRHTKYTNVCVRKLKALSVDPLVSQKALLVYRVASSWANGAR